MKTLKRSVEILLCLSLLLSCTKEDNNENANQVERHPQCYELEVKDITFDHTTGYDTVYVTVFNDCDFCNQNIYTGLLITRGSDTLALTRSLTSWFSPANNSSHTYTLQTTDGLFIMSKLSKVTMPGVCDDIYFSSEVLSIENAQ